MLMWLVGDFMAAAQHNQGALHCIFLAKDKIQICSLVSTEGVSRLYSHEAERLYSEDHLYLLLFSVCRLWTWSSEELRDISMVINYKVAAMS